MATITESRRVGLDAPRWAGWCGMVAGPLWITVVVLLTAAEWDFLHAAGWSVFGADNPPYPSYTALGPYGAVQVVNFAVAGLLVLAFVQGLARHLQGRTGTAGRVLLSVAAVAMSTSAFKTDPVDADVTWHGAIHMASFLLLAVGSVLGMSLAGLGARRTAGWERWARVTAWLGPWQVLMFVGGGAVLPGDTSFYLFLLTLFGWIAVTGRRLSLEP